MAQDAPAAVAAAMRETMQRTGVEGLAIAFVRDGKVAWTAGVGVTDVAAAAPVTPATTFQAASLGKVSAAYAAMILVDRGVLALDAPLADERLRIAAGCSAPTVAQALSHTTGLSNDLRAATLLPDCVPGTRFRYSGQGYAVVGTMIATATGKRAPDAIDELVFRPLGMRTTRYGPPLGASQASGHASVAAAIAGLALTRLPIWLILVTAVGVLGALVVAAATVVRRRGAAAGTLILVLATASCAAAVFAGLRINTKADVAQPSERIASSLSSNAVDMGKFVAELLQPTLLSRASRDAMFTPHTANAGCIQWGLGIGIDACAGHTTYWQWGSNLGFQSLLVLDPARRSGVVVLTNTGGGLDALIEGRGGYAATRQIARDVLARDGRWVIGAR